MYQKILKKVGIILVIIGVAGIFYFAVMAMRGGRGGGFTMSDILSLLSVVCGIGLIKNNLQIARITAIAASFLIGFFIINMIQLVVLYNQIFPQGYYLEYLKTKSSASIIFALLSIIVAFSVLFWIYKNLTNTVVTEAMKLNGQDFSKPWKKPSAGFAYGAIAAILYALFTRIILIYSAIGHFDFKYLF